MTVKDYYEVIRDIDRLAAVVDAEGAVTLDHDDAEQIWAQSRSTMTMLSRYGRCCWTTRIC